MDSMINPSLFSLFLKTASNYLSDLDRLKLHNIEKIKKHRNKSFQKLVKYANSVPLYNRKFKDAKISHKKIKGFEDIEKFPIINREDVKANYPSGIIAPGLEKNSIIVSTSGSTRTPVSLYLDQFTLLKALIIYARELRYYGIRWNKSRLSLIANFYSDTAPTQYFASGVNPVFQPFKFAFPLDKIQQINCDDDLLSITKRVDEFKPDCIMGFPGPIRHLALLREKGYGQNINPKCIISSGGILDEYEKNHVEEVFSTRVFDVYGANEVGPISFECEEGNYHIHSDIQYIEAIDLKGNLKEIGKEGILAITRIYGRGTPLIRYTGLDDIIALKDGNCDCGLNTELLKVVQGRIKESIVLPDGRIIYPRKLMDIPGNVMCKLKTNKIYLMQVVQESLEKIEVLVIIDEEKREESPPTEIFLKELEKNYQQLFGNNVEVNVKEVKELRSEEDRPDIKPGVLSKIDVKKYI